MIHSHNTNHNLVPSNSVDRRTVTNLIFLIWTFLLETTLCGVQDVNLTLDYQEVYETIERQQWHGKAE